MCHTSEIMLRWSTLFHADHRTVKLNFSLLVSFHDGCGHDHCLVTVRALCCLSTGLWRKRYEGAEHDFSDIMNNENRCMHICTQKQQLCLRGESVLLPFCSKRLTIKHFVMKNTFLKLRSWIDYCNSCRKNFTLPRIDPPLYDMTGQTTEPPKYAKTSIQV